MVSERVPPRPMLKKKGTVSNMASSMYKSLRNLTGRKKAKVAPMPAAPSEFIAQKKLAERMWLPGLEAERIDVSASVLQEMRRKTSTTVKAELTLLYGTVVAMGGADSYFLGISKPPGQLIGLYELSNYADGVLFKRVCDQPVRELIKHKLLPAAWPQKYEPVNAFGGSRKLPTGASVRDVLSVK